MPSTFVCDQQHVQVQHTGLVTRMLIRCCLCRVFGTFSIPQARGISPILQCGNQPLQVHVCSGYSASDTGDHWLLHWSWSASPDDRDAVQSGDQSV